MWIALVCMAVAVGAPICILYYAALQNSSQAEMARLEAKINASHWSPFTPNEISALQSRLSKIPPEPVVIGCETLKCKDLSESFGTAFRLAGWDDVEFICHGGLGISGVSGLLLEPGDERTSEIIAAIEDTTPLKVQPPVP